MNHLSRRSVLGLAAAAVAAPLAVSALPAVAAQQAVLPSDAWTYTTSRLPSHSFWDDPRPEVLVGKQYDDPYVWRSFFRVPVAALAGATIDAAAFTILLTHTPTGLQTPVELFHVSDLDPAVPVSWSESPAFLEHLGTTVGASYGSQPDLRLGFDVRALVQDAAARSLPSLSFALKAVDEANRIQWKKFAPDTAALEVFSH